MKCIATKKNGKSCKKDGVMVTGQCVKHWYVSYLYNGKKDMYGPE